MSEFIYRFRSIEKLLQFKELEQQSIYFAPPFDLNDPVEDYKDIFWQGDEILWSNLFKNYLLCLDHIYLLIRISGEDTPLKVDEIPVFSTYDNLPTQQYKDRMQNIFQEFFANEKIKALIQGLSKRDNIRRNELLFYLEAIHIYSIHLIKKHDTSLDEAKKEINNIDGFMNEKVFTNNFFELISNAKDEFKDLTNLEDILFSTIQHTSQQTKLLNILNAEKMEKNKKFYLLDFPRNYVQQIEKLMFWPWYTACFTKTPTNSSMWGYYTDGHRGVCLKFKTTNYQSKRGIFLNTITGYGGSKNEVKKHYGKSFFELHNINYESKVKPINFFKSIGRLPYPALINQWYSDVNKNVSGQVQDVLTSQDEWRTNYWKTFFSNIPIKTEEWKHEEEVRLIQTSILSGTIPDEDRVLNYDFNDLEGIIFGVNMSEENKINLIEIIHDICMKKNRFDFNFYQAGYNNHSGKIDIQKLGLIQFTKS